MEKEDWSAVVAVMRKAPLADMAAAEAVAGLIEKVIAHANNLFPEDSNGEDLDGD